MCLYHRPPLGPSHATWLRPCRACLFVYRHEIFLDTGTASDMQARGVDIRGRNACTTAANIAAETHAQLRSGLSNR